ncbi:RcnB family protein [Paraburkholderia phosphatilytica]|uniref:RcnB family protein n=1 Tax=Paraburkholderia phosphatilytica TaxID=2282883 RepID=UPI000E4F5EC9|nr:RcnB family protein [Paraburkholderia phosphatilytica]
MNLKSITPLVLAALVAVSAPVHAQQQPRPDHRGVDRRGPPHDAPVDRPGGPLPHEDWHKGDRLPTEYRDRNYVVDDWRGHGLSAPPHGYHWVGVNGDYVLAAVTTGVIASVLASGH